MERFYIITNEMKDPDFQVTHRICDYIRSCNRECILAQKDTKGYILPESIPSDIDCALVLGGDGTLIQAARELRGTGIPILGINMGTLGYLAEVEVNNIEDNLSRLFTNNYYMEFRMMMQGSVNGAPPKSAVNDIVITREGSLRIVHFDIYVDGELLNSYKADGVIISTPTGSTGYNLSAGGPIVEPTAQMFVITPICPHSLNTSSIVLSAEDRIEIEIGKARYGGTEQTSVSFDGKEGISLTTGDRIRIERMGESAGFIKLSNESFLKTMRRKMKGN